MAAVLARSETEPHDIIEDEEAVLPSVSETEFKRIGGGADAETVGDDVAGAADEGADDDCDDEGVEFCAAAERVTLSDRRGQDGSFAK